MRSHEFLSEAALAPKTFYVKDRLVNLIKRIREKDDFLTLSGEYVKIPATPKELSYLGDLVRTNYDAQNTVISNSRMPNIIGGVPLSKLMKTADFGGKAGVGATGEKVGEANIGPTVEALKSMAIFAKLISRGKESIDTNDVLRIADIMKENAKEVLEKGKKVATTSSSYSRKVYDVSRKVQDTISLEINLSTPPFLRAVNISPDDKKAWGTLQGIITYVNTESDVKKYSRFFAGNNKRDPVNIGVVGISGAKTDILATRTEPDGTERPLSHLSMSIKAGSSMYDQSSGMNAEGIENLYDILGMDPLSAYDAMRATGFKGKERNAEDSPQSAKERVAAVKGIYELLGIQLESRIGSLNDKGEADFIHDFLGRLKKSIQGDQPLVYVNFDTKGTYNKLNPQLIDQLASSIDLGVTVDLDSKSTPYIYLIDKITNKPIIHVRLAILKSGRMTNTFELDYLLDLVKAAQKKQKQNIDLAQPPEPGSEVGQAKISQKPSTQTVKPSKPVTPAPATAPKVGDQMGADADVEEPTFK